jgi:hypothetical protein
MITTENHSIASVLSRHPVHGVEEFADAAARTGHVYAATDVFKAVLQTNNLSWWLITDVDGAGAATFRPIFLQANYHGFMAAGANAGAWSAVAYDSVIGAGKPIAAADWTDGPATGISRAGSVFTIAVAGRYKFSMLFPFNSTGPAFFGVRLVGSTFGAKPAQHSYQNATDTVAPRVALFEVDCVDGETVTVQYAINGTGKAFVNSAVGGAAGSLGFIDIEQIG